MKQSTQFLVQVIFSLLFLVAVAGYTAVCGYAMTSQAEVLKVIQK